IVLPTTADQLRLVASGRADRYDIPSAEDQQRESDLFVNGTWLRTLSSSTLLTITPSVHTNSANLEGRNLRDRLRSQYAGAEMTYATTTRGNDFRAGAFGFHQRDDARLTLNPLSERDTPTGSVVAIFFEDRYDLSSHLTIRAGGRYTRFRGGRNGSAFTPRIGASLRIASNVIVRASYSDTYQAPPLSTVSGPLLQFAAQQGFGFLPLHGERDHQAEIGIAIPISSWNVDAAAFRTHARNFFDHDVLGHSNMFFPLTVDRVLIR